MADCTIRMEYLKIYWGARQDVDRALARLRTQGCTVSYADVVRARFSTTYYNLKIEGPYYALNAFRKWVVSIG